MLPETCIQSIAFGEKTKTVLAERDNVQKTAEPRVVPVNFNRGNQCLVKRQDYTEEHWTQIELIQGCVLLDYVREQEHEPTRKRLRNHSKHEQHRLLIAGAISIAFQSGRCGADLIFATINLKGREDYGQALRNMRKAVLAETGIRIGWAGVYVPESEKVHTTQPHVHVLLTNVELHGAAWDAINRFMDGRNRNMQRSCHMTWAYGLDGLVNYIEGEKNLCRRNAKLVKTDEVLAEARKVCEDGYGTLVAIGRRLVETIVRGPGDRSDEARDAGIDAPAGGNPVQACDRTALRLPVAMARRSAESARRRSLRRRPTSAAPFETALCGFLKRRIPDAVFRPP